MKENTTGQNKAGHCPPHTNKFDDDVKWFEQFDSEPGIYDVMNKAEAVLLKQQMLSNIKAEISKKD